MNAENPTSFAPAKPEVMEGALKPPFRPSTLSPHNREVENFIATGDRMRETQRRKLIELESTHEIARVKLIDGFRTRLLELEHEAGEALRKFDADHNAEVAAHQRILDALVRMRA